VLDWQLACQFSSADHLSYRIVLCTYNVCILFVKMLNDIQLKVRTSCEALKQWCKGAGTCATKHNKLKQV